MTRYMPRIIGLPAALSIAALIGGCASMPSGHAEAKKAAEGRWHDARSGIIYSIARQQLETGDLDKAEQTINQALVSKPDQPEFHELAARIDLERGLLEKAYYKLENAIKLKPDRPEPHYLMGMVLQRWQRYQGALESYQTAFKHSPDQVGGLLAGADMLVKLDRVDEAADLLRQKLDYFENNAAIRVSLGRIQQLRHEPEKAMLSYREAATLAPDDLSIQERLAMAQCAANRPGEAICTLTDLLKQPDYTGRDDLKLTLGDCLLAVNRPIEARAIFLDLTRRNVNDVPAWIKLGQAAWIVGDLVRVEEAGRRIVALAPDRHEGCLLRGMLDQREGRLQQAIGWFDQASELAPDKAQPLILKGMAMKELGDKSGAAAAYRKAQQLAPDDPRPGQLLATLAP